ncbi:hypothetical protein [Streptomyces sp. NPDC002078]
MTQRPVFEPALKQHQNAYRATDPAFADPARSEAWRTALRQALHLVELPGPAVLPAESHPLPYGLLLRVFQLGVSSRSGWCRR